MTTIDNPIELHTAWADRFNAQDLEGMLALAEPVSTFVPQPGAATTGADARRALEQFLSFGLPTSDVARRGTEGWKFVVDNPIGTA